MKRLILAIVATALVAAWPLAHAGTALVVEHDAGPPDAIIMLASHEWERLPAAAALARRYPEAVVLITVPRVVTVYTCHRCDERVDWFEAEGVNRERIRQLAGAANTFDEAVLAREHAAQEPFERLAIVTTPYHTRRALATFRTIFAGSGISTAAVPASPAQGRPERWWATPYDRYYVRYEWAAILAYWARHSVPPY
ncbi:MAG: YdcF family protein [Acidobacteria bacterium]|nr:YdcF family protein [Acidobacteriota bacterium]